MRKEDKKKTLLLLPKTIQKKTSKWKMYLPKKKNTGSKFKLELQTKKSKLIQVMQMYKTAITNTYMMQLDLKKLLIIQNQMPMIMMTWMASTMV